MKGIIVVDVDRCLACRSCELACAVAHSETKVLEKAINEDPLPQNRVFVEFTGEKSEGRFSMGMPLQCRHCEDAPCVAICPTGAIEKPEAESPVVIKDELCIGCKWCILACPFGVINIGHRGRVAIKCDFCKERLEKQELPACVSACSTKALRFSTLEELTEEKRKEATKELVLELKK